VRTASVHVLQEHELDFFLRLGRHFLESLRLRAGSITRWIPARIAASTFSLMPPTGSTRPRRLISPVIAVVGAHGALHEERGRAR